MRKLFIIVGIFLLTSGVAYAIMGIIPLEGLVDQADLIILGRVESATDYKKKVESSEGSFVMWSRAKVVTKRVLKGDAHSKSIQIEFEGGPSRLEDSPDYIPDEDVVVFLKKIEGKLSYRTVGMFQGKYTIRDGKVVRRNIPIDEFLKSINSILSRQDK